KPNGNNYLMRSPHLPLAYVVLSDILFGKWLLSVEAKRTCPDESSCFSQGVQNYAHPLPKIPLCFSVRPVPCFSHQCSEAVRTCRLCPLYPPIYWHNSLLVEKTVL